MRRKLAKKENMLALVVSRQRVPVQVSVDALVAIPEEEVWLESQVGLTAAMSAAVSGGELSAHPAPDRAVRRLAPQATRRSLLQGPQRQSAW